jgi:uncharacterized protein
MHLTLHLTRACNLRCSYCYSPPQPGPTMTLATARQALRFGAGATAGSCGIVLFGGEPLLCAGLIRELVAEARAMTDRGEGHFHFKITTNGLLLDEAFLDFAVANDILVAMSLDGLAEAHDRHRRLPDGSPTFDRLLPRLRRLLAVRPYSSVLMVVNPDTVQWLSESVRSLLDLGCRYLIVSLNYAAAWGEADFEVLASEYERLGDGYIRWTREGRKFYLSPLEVKIASHIEGDGVCHEHCELGCGSSPWTPRDFSIHASSS